MRAPSASVRHGYCISADIDYGLAYARTVGIGYLEAPVVDSLLTLSVIVCIYAGNGLLYFCQFHVCLFL